MRLRDRLTRHEVTPATLRDTYGVSANPFPSANQSGSNVHFPIPADDQLENSIVKFFDDHKSQVVVIVGTQGVGKTNILNHIETEIKDACVELPSYYLVRYMADPEPSFDGIVRTIFQELGVDHLTKIAERLAMDPSPLDLARSYDLRSALLALSENPNNKDLSSACLDWLFGSRILNYHRSNLHVNFRLDTVESRTAILRDYVIVSSESGVLGGIFLLLDELEKQAGVLATKAVVRYLSALRAIIDAFSDNLFMVIAVTHDAMLRYSSALPALRSRLEDRIELSTLESADEGRRLAEFYIDRSRSASARVRDSIHKELLTQQEITQVFGELMERSSHRGDAGVRQREFLHGLHSVVERKIQKLKEAMPIKLE